MKSSRSQNEKRQIKSLLKSKSSRSRNAELYPGSGVGDPAVESRAAPQQLTLGKSPRPTSIPFHPHPREGLRRLQPSADVLVVSARLKSRSSQKQPSARAARRRPFSPRLSPLFQIYVN